VVTKEMAERERERAMTRALARYGLERDAAGDIKFTAESSAKLDRTGFKAVYCDSLISYLKIFDTAYRRAQNQSEFELVSLLIRMHGMEDPGWDPFESTQTTVRLVRRAIGRVDSFEAERTLQLWLYGHIVEASEPYEILMNLSRIIAGERYCAYCFPTRNGRPPLSPGEKIRAIEASVARVELSDVVLPVREIWDRDFRNALFHSDYSLSGNEVRIRNPLRVLSHETVMGYINRALAFFNALVNVDSIYRASFDKPRLIPVHPEFAKWPQERAWVIVRQDYGAIGLRDALDQDELRRGKIPWFFGRFRKTELDQMMGSERPVSFPKEIPESESHP
jgi:hypothetical protein